MQKPLKVHSYVTPVFAFFFDLCRTLLENANVKSKQPSLVAIELLLDVTCEQDLWCIHTGCLRDWDRDRDLYQEQWVV